MKFVHAEIWEQDPGIIHGFGVRCSGEKKPARRDWLGRRVVTKTSSLPLFSLRQVHGDRIVRLDGNNLPVEKIWQEEGDCLITRTPGIALGVFTADCLPILLYDPERRAIGVIHTGWRGTARGVARKAVESMVSDFRCDGAKIEAALGPCIGPCCYEVDSPVRQAFDQGGFPWDSVSHSRGEGKWSLDLSLANSLLLEASGVRKENIAALNLCTSCRGDLFYSYRKGDQAGGRQMNFIALR